MDGDEMGAADVDALLARIDDVQAAGLEALVARIEQNAGFLLTVVPRFPVLARRVAGARHLTLEQRHDLIALLGEVAVACIKRTERFLEEADQSQISTQVSEAEALAERFRCNLTREGMDRLLAALEGNAPDDDHIPVIGAARGAQSVPVALDEDEAGVLYVTDIADFVLHRRRGVFPDWHRTHRVLRTHRRPGE